MPNQLINWIGFLIVCLAASPLLGGIAVGVYDENVAQTNAVDFTASGSAVDHPTFTAQVLAAFAADQGGVINCDDVSLPFDYAFGVNQTKRIRFVPSPGFAYGSHVGGYGPCVRTPISDGNAFLSAMPFPQRKTLSLQFSPVSGFAPNEGIVEIAMTVLSQSEFGQPYDQGLVTGTAQLSSGGTLTASRVISEGNAAGDTFFAFLAPPGKTITNLTFTNSQINQDGYLTADDFGFITAIVPEPTAILPMAAALAVLMRRKRAGT